MALRTSPRQARAGLAAALAVTLLGLGAVVHAATPSSGASAHDHPCLVVTGSGDTPFVRNFNPFALPEPIDFTWGGIYEPLVVITNAGGGHEYPWLASALAWSDDHKTLTLTVRHGVEWSDGQPFTSRDVLFTLTAGRQDKDMDQIGLTRPGNQVASIELVGSDKVAIHLKARNSSFIPSVLANNLHVVPEHVWAHVRHASAWMNPHPVGTGPFAVVRHFGDQDYILGRNPHYWLAGAPHFACIERVLGSSTEAAVFQMLHGDIDLTNNFVPHAEQAYVAHDPRHFHFFYPTVGLPVGLYLDDTKYPFSLPAFRQGVSMAIDRDTLSRLAEQGYAPAVDAIGTDRVWRSWIDPKTAAEAKRLAAYNPAAAKRTLLAAGFSYRDGMLVDPHGSPVVIKAKVIESWIDWVTAWKVIARNLRSIGIEVDVHLSPSWGDWQSDAFSTKVATLLWGGLDNGPTPYAYFQQHLDRAAFIPSGKAADVTGNWEHFQSGEGTRLLKAFRNTFDRAAQRELVARLQRVWLETLPYVPLFVGPEWSTYSTRHFTGFPSERDFYLQPSFATTDYAVALTRIRPI